MKTSKYLLYALAGAIFFACQPKAKSSDNSINNVTDLQGEVPDTLILRTFVNQLYDDILQKYEEGEEGMKYAFKNYASEELIKVLEDADKASQKSGIAILGWDCDPWIFAQDWEHPKAVILKTYTQSNSQGYVDVLIQDGDDRMNDRKVRLLLITENGEWKVNDFIDTESAPTFKEVLIKEMSDASK